MDNEQFQGGGGMGTNDPWYIHIKAIEGSDA